MNCCILNIYFSFNYECYEFLEFQENHDEKWLTFLEKSDLLDISFLFKLLVFWSRDFWKRIKLNEDNCASIRHVICSVIMNNANARTYILKICTQNLISVALNQGNHGYDQASCFLTEAVINAFNVKRAKLEEAIENPEKKKDTSDPATNIKITPDEIKLYDALACVVLSTKTSR